MRRFFVARTIVSIIILAILGLGWVVFVVFKKEDAPKAPIVENTYDLRSKEEIIGKSVEKRNINAHTFGNGNTRIIFVGGIHGGYEWNSALLAYEAMRYLENNPNVIPENLSVTIIPSANPDGVYKVLGKEGSFSLADVPKVSTEISESGRFNSNGVDLNRNFDCNWQSKSTWKSKTVSAGTKAFSEPESVAIRDFILKNNPVAVIFWHSQSNAVYASECNDGVLPETLDIMEVYSQASGYPAIKSFDSYKITGDAEGWLASIDIPAITVELKTHETIEWQQNLTGIKAILKYYTDKPR